jgi:hypothetical protein
MAAFLPRSTRARPVLEFPVGIPVYTNNIKSPGPFHVTDFTINKASFLVYGLACKIDRTAKVIIIDEPSFKLKEAKVEFWSTSHKAILSVAVCIPLDWDAIMLLHSIEASVQEHKCISLINSYTLMGRTLPFNTINKIHYLFKF